ncbi:hypothetical protein MKD52_04650 [Helicobacter sp. CaF467b]|uniref:hypothetical protein n=1 Tax=Helicobacter sp. CaF467b TaxID=2919923 RepID=UPI001F565032|nr:hypothetical protein [Helicobacter sp. CaF467b]MCI2236117.1 hypothetical protein [Helicobacter sp. CaF467b]
MARQTSKSHAITKQILTNGFALIAAKTLQTTKFIAIDSIITDSLTIDSIANKAPIFIALCFVSL